MCMPLPVMCMPQPVMCMPLPVMALPLPVLILPFSVLIILTSPDKSTDFAFFLRAFPRAFPARPENSRPLSHCSSIGGPMREKISTHAAAIAIGLLLCARVRGVRATPPPPPINYRFCACHYRFCACHYPLCADHNQLCACHNRLCT